MRGQGLLALEKRMRSFVVIALQNGRIMFMRMHTEINSCSFTVKNYRKECVFNALS